MAFIQPLELQTWIISVFSGSQQIFLAVSMFFIFGMAAYFRMTALTMFMMFAIFLVIFNQFIDSYILMMLGIFGGLLVGYWVSRLVK
jgi:hypothetical protein